MKSQRLTTIWGVILLVIFLSSSYLCYDFGVQKTEIVEEKSGGKGKASFGTTYSVSVDTSLSTGYNGAAIGFGIIAGSSLLSLSLLVNTGTTQKEF